MYFFSKQSEIKGFTVVCIYYGWSLFQDFEETIHSAEKNDTSYERQGCFQWKKYQKVQNGQLKKPRFPAPPILNIFCKNFMDCSTYMAVTLSDVSSKTGKKCIFCFFPMKTSLPFIWGIIFFCTMDGFFRILENTSSELICTRLYIQQSLYSRFPNNIM